MDRLIGNTPKRFTTSHTRIRRLPFGLSIEWLAKAGIICLVVLIATPSRAMLFSAIQSLPELIRSMVVSSSDSDQEMSERQLRSYVLEVSNEYQVPPSLTWGIIAAGSKFDAEAVSAAGAVGLMQVMPETASEMGVENIHDARQNILGGVRYLSYLLKRFEGDHRKAVVAYRMGPGIAERNEKLSSKNSLFVEEVLKTSF